VALLTTVIATPVVIAMEGVALGTGGVGVVFNLVYDKVLSSEARKHIRIMMLAGAKINKISDHISKLLKDNHVSDDEFTLILSELDQFNQMKDEIRTRTKTKIDDETKQSLIKEGKEQTVEQFNNMFGKTH
jgi:dsDNA-specific endonuclease/ATPase MutS2